MALVVLPCDLPHWSNLQKQLSSLFNVNSTKEFIEGMFKIYNMCNISTGLDPDEPEQPDPTLFSQLEIFLTDLADEERTNFYKKILPVMIRRALELKTLKPAKGFHFSLQQQGDEMVYKRSFLASLLAHSFFSTFPKRTWKTHPTLQDFNFTNFFKFLNQVCQQAKLKSIFHYFELIENVDENECVTYSRQVMSSKQWMTIDDWVESCLPLCPIAVRNDGSLNDVEPQCLRICFSSSKIGGSVLGEGTSQESIEFSTIPELLCILASVEALEDNEVFLVKDAYQISRINKPRQNVVLQKFEKPVRVCLCCMDPENYSRLPVSQLEEDNVLRELNKALLGFRQGKSPNSKFKIVTKGQAQLKRLSPIGESFSSTPREKNFSKEGTPFSVSSSRKLESERKKAWLHPPTMADEIVETSENKRNKFIVLGSSGECLPVTRNQTFLAGKQHNLTLSSFNRMSNDNDSLLSSSNSEEEEIFHSARSSLGDEKEEFDEESSSEGFPKTAANFSNDDEMRYSFAERLREALLRGARTYSTSTNESSYAVDISLSGSLYEGANIRCKRGTSTGFMLQEESLECPVVQDSLENELQKKLNESDKYSFTTDGTDIEVYDQISKWINTGKYDLQDDLTRHEAISEFASTLLKRALSDTYAISGEDSQGKRKTVLAARSFSLELAKRNPKLAVRLVYLLLKKDFTLKSMLPNKDGQKPVATGNWGCGSCQGGDPQIKLTIQWLAASYSGLPNLIYYTCRHHKLVKLDTVRRVLIDRGWTVGQLATSLLQYARTSLYDPSATLFDSLIMSVHG